MTVRVGINGFGRIGRNFWRAVQATRAPMLISRSSPLMTWAISGRSRTCSSTTRCSARSAWTWRRAATRSPRAPHTIRMFAERDPAALPWADLGVDVVVESTGRFTERADARKHIEAGASKVIISAPGERRGHHDRDGRQRRQLRPGSARHHLERLVHHELRGADGQGAARRLRHRQGPDDHHPCLHQRPGDPGLPAQGPAPGARRRAEHHPDDAPAPPGPPRWCCPSCRASWTACRCACR